MRCSEVVLTNANGVQRGGFPTALDVLEISRGHVSVGKGDSAMRAVSPKRKFTQVTVSERSSNIDHVLTVFLELGELLNWK
jgi:hypothetical protein